jgi:hypothetical protein
MSAHILGASPSLPKPRDGRAKRRKGQGQGVLGEPGRSLFISSGFAFLTCQPRRCRALSLPP